MNVCLVHLRNKVRQIDGLEGFLDVCLVRLRNEVRQIDGLRGYWMCALCTSEIMLDKEREERQFFGITGYIAPLK